METVSDLEVAHAPADNESKYFIYYFNNISMKLIIWIGIVTPPQKNRLRPSFWTNIDSLLVKKFLQSLPHNTNRFDARFQKLILEFESHFCKAVVFNS